jgi:hypothetical protein
MIPVADEDFDKFLQPLQSLVNLHFYLICPYTLTASDHKIVISVYAVLYNQGLISICYGLKGQNNLAQLNGLG